MNRKNSILTLLILSSSIFVYRKTQSAAGRDQKTSPTVCCTGDCRGAVCNMTIARDAIGDAHYFALSEVNHDNFYKLGRVTQPQQEVVALQEGYNFTLFEFEPTTGPGAGKTLQVMLFTDKLVQGEHVSANDMKAAQQQVSKGLLKEAHYVMKVMARTVGASKGTKSGKAPFIELSMAFSDYPFFQGASPVATIQPNGIITFVNQTTDGKQYNIVLDPTNAR